MLGPGQYNDLCTYVRKKVKAQGAIVIVLNGNRAAGAGFSFQFQSPELWAATPAALREAANQIEEEYRKTLISDPGTTSENSENC